ncbi:GNAT family N-acetyltransferase [soil metagenome]
MNKIEIIPYTTLYEEQVFSLILKIQNDEFGVPITISDQPDLANIPKHYQQNNDNFWIALDGNNVIGTIALHNIGNVQAILKKMYVHPTYRGKNLGVAKLLFDTLCHWSKSKGIHEIYLGTTAFFIAAQKFYEHCGFYEITKGELPISFPITQYHAKFYKYHL